MSQFPNRAALWLNKLAPDAPLMSGLCPSVQVADGHINGENVRFIAVVPDANNHYPRAAGGEVGLLEGWTLAKVVNETIAADADQPGNWPDRRQSDVRGVSGPRLPGQPPDRL